MTQHDTTTSRTFLKVTLQLCSCKIASLVNPFTSENEFNVNPVRAWILFRPYFHYCSSSAHYCEDHLRTYSLLIDRSPTPHMFFLITVNLKHHQSLRILLWLFFLQSGCQGRLHLWETHVLRYTLSKWHEFSSSLIGFESLQNLPAFSNNLPLIHYQSAWLPQSNYLSFNFLAEVQSCI